MAKRKHTITVLHVFATPLATHVDASALQNTNLRGGANDLSQKSPKSNFDL
jgi:hypothetical protein